MNKVRIEVDHLSFSYGQSGGLHDVSLSIEGGELFAVVGPSGAGKTTLLRLLAGLERPLSGRVALNGIDVIEMQPGQRHIGMVFQGLSLWPHMTVAENVAFGAGALLPEGESLHEQVNRLLTMLAIADTRDALPSSLSAGQQQRVALARALVSSPRLLLLDDPFSNLEQGLRAQMRRDLRFLQRKLGITTVLVTHDLEDALSTADRLAVLVQGSVRQLGTPAVIYDFPATIDVADFVGVGNFVSGSVRHGEGSSTEFYSPDLGRVRWMTRDRPPEGRAVLSIRPHALLVCPVDSFRDARYYWIEGDLVASEFLGEVVSYRVAIGDTSLCVKHPHFLGVPVTPAGTPVLVGFDPLHARIFPMPSGDASGDLGA